MKRVLVVADHHPHEHLQGLLAGAAPELETDFVEIGVSEAATAKWREADVVLLHYVPNAAERIARMMESGEEHRPPVLVIDGTGGEARHLEVLRRGAQDFLVEDELDTCSLHRAIRHALERQRLRDALEAQSRRFRKVVEANVDGMLVVDRAGEVQFANPAAEQLLGRAGDELTGRPFGIPLVADENAEIDVRLPRGETGVAELRITEIDWEGEPAWLASLRDISERKAHEEEILRHQKRLGTLSKQLAQAEEKERRQLAKVLHDHLQQMLVSCRMKLQLASREDGDALKHLLGELDATLEESIQVTRTLTAELSPTVLYDAGLAAALGWLASNQQAKYNIKIEAIIEEELEPDDEHARRGLFEATRELVFNAAKHSRTDRIEIRLRRHEDEAEIEVRDFGVGFDAGKLQSSDKGFGLFSTRERMEALGGVVLIESTPGEGTRAFVRAPLSSA